MGQSPGIRVDSARGTGGPPHNGVLVRKDALWAALPSGLRVRVLRVARDQSWADIRVRQPDGFEWTKRQPLPFPETWERLC